jgi:hypothetical protein
MFVAASPHRGSALTCGLKITVSPELQEDLLRHLRGHVDVIAAVEGTGALAVGLLGSRRYEFARAEIERRLVAWNEATPGADAAIEDSAAAAVAGVYELLALATTDDA